MSLYSSWVHGHNVQLERVGAPGAHEKYTVRKAFSIGDTRQDKGEPGDIVDLGGSAAAACLRLGWAARFVVYDSGRENREKSGSFWIHYAIPTPVMEAGIRAEADTVLINYESSDINALSIAAVHVWDGNRRIFCDDSPTASADDYDGGIAGSTTNASVVPNPGELWRGNIDRQPVYFGVGVSINIRAHGAKADVLEIRSVGIDFEVP